MVTLNKLPMPPGTKYELARTYVGMVAERLALVPLSEPWARRRLVVGRRDVPVMPAAQAVLDALAARKGAQPAVKPG